MHDDPLLFVLNDDSPAVTSNASHPELGLSPAGDDPRELLLSL